MEESYETFEEELGPSTADPPPQKPVRQIRRPGGHTHAHAHTHTISEQQNREPLKYDSWSEATVIMQPC
ncbi:hypothetical protein KUCAC02_018200 [Chaenocephalus aceratus]|uniref:Uncharacterized protein n=1 Tax=Chaenocephalus aceratus TaxID=36190 RepID=A0ACB9W908_CHAAC|nr:hypothetical protein KUCAC02_018200 [Chaenocephalus aceratus]